jgi:secreted trypsin-like serine protease
MTVGLRMRLSTGTSTICTGTLVDQDLVVTAGHCLKRKPKSLTILFGLNMDEKETVARDTAAYEVHPKYNENEGKDGNNDIALIQFSGGIPPGFSPAGIVPADQVIHPGDDFLIAGFGHTSTSSSGKTGVLHRTTLEVEKPDYSKTEYSFTQKTSGACFGDSGGPAYREVGGAWLLAGVTSRGSQNCVGFLVYIRVEKHGDWLMAAAERLRKTQ